MVISAAESGRAESPLPASPSIKDLRQAARVFLAEDLTKRLDLTTVELQKGNYLNALVESGDGKLLIKFYPRPAAAKVRRSVMAHGLLAEHGLEVAVLRHADDSEASLTRYGLACIATRWVEGRPLPFGDQAATTRAFALLSQIHDIRFDRLEPHLIARLGVPASAAQDNTLEITAQNFEVAIAAVQKEAPVAVRPDEVTAMKAFLIGWAEEAARWQLPQVLLHYDFHCSNLIQTPKGTIVPIDLESAMFGRFFVDLSRSIFKFAYKPSAAALDQVGIEQLARAPWLDSALEPYLAQAAPEARDFWHKHRDMVVFWGYFRTLRSLAQRARTQRGLRSVRRHPIRQQLRRRWEQMLGFAERASG